MAPRFSMPQLSNLTKDPWPFLACWVIGGLLSIIVPVLKWNAAKQDYYDSYGYAIEYEQQQRAYEEQQNGDNNNNYNWYNYPSCHWWQYKCRLNQFNYRQNAEGNNNNNNNNGEYQLSFPNWFVFFGGSTEEDRRWQEEQGNMDGGESSGGLKFVYAWLLVMFVSILFYGGFVLVKKRTVGPLLIMMCMFFQFSILAMVLICQGVLMTDDRDLEDSIYGWYGQIGVLIMYTNTGYLWFTFIFAVVLLARAFWQRHVAKTGDGDAEPMVDAEKGDNYYAADDYEAPEVKIT